MRKTFALTVLLVCALIGPVQAQTSYTTPSSMSATRTACTLASNIWTCDPAGFSMGTITLTSAQRITMGKPGTSAGQFFTIRLLQDAVGGRIPIWGSMFLFQNSSIAVANRVIPLTLPSPAVIFFF
jgi:hypothetical protein